MNGQVVNDFFPVSPCACVFVGPPSSRKTTYFKRFILNIDYCCPGPPLELVTIFYDTHQQVYNEIKEALPCETRVVKGIPDVDYEDYFPSFDKTKRQVVCFDDLSYSLRRKHVATLWRRLSSVYVQHKNILLVFILHELSANDAPVLSFIRKNCTFFACFGVQSSNLALLERQFFPYKKNLLFKVYKYVRDELGASYLILDLNAHATRQLKTGVLDPDEQPYVFVTEDV